MILKSFYSNWILLLIICASAIMGILRFNSFQVGGFHDDAYYIVLSESLASGHGYSLINFPDGRPERNFPPGWPLLLTPITAFFPGHYTVLKILPFLLWLISIALIYKLFARRVNEPYLAILVTLIALNPSLVGLSGMLMSEVAFIFFTLLTLNIFEYWNNNREKASDWILILVAVSALYAQTVRTVGIAIVMAIILYLLLKRYFRHLGIFLIVVAIGLIVQFWFNSQNGGGLISSGYEEQVLGNSSLITKIAQMLENAQGYSGEIISNSLIPILGLSVTANLDKLNLGFLPTLINIGILLLVILGIILSIPNYRVSDLYVGFYFLGILTFWNPEVGSVQPRFLLPIVPFLYLYLFNGILWIVNHIMRQKNRYVFAVVASICSLLLLVSVARNLQDWRNPVRDRITDLSIGRIWIRENSLPNAIVLARNPVSDYLYLRRKTVAYPEDGQNISDYIRNNNIDYILLSPKLETPRSTELDDFTKSQILPVVQTNLDDFYLVYENATEGVLVYRVNK